MVSFLDRCIFTPTATGTGTWTVAAAVQGYQTPAQASASNGATYYYAAQNLTTPTEWEIGTSTYTVAGTTATRTVIAGSNGASAVNFTAVPTVQYGDLLTAGFVFSALSGTAVETQGGTNQTSYTQGDLLYASAANTLSKLAKDTNSTRSLTNTGSSNNPAWAQVALATGVSGTLPIANGGTNDTGTAWTTTTPTPTSNAGTGFAGTASLKVKTLGKTCFVRAAVTISNVGNTPAATQVSIPLSPTAAQVTPLYGIDNASGLVGALTGQYTNSTNIVLNGTVAATTYEVGGVYETT